jgi:hypothetical protein
MAFCSKPHPNNSEAGASGITMACETGFSGENQRGQLDFFETFC